MLFKHIKSKEKVSTIIGSWIMNIRNLIHSLQLDEVNQTWPPDMIPGHIQRILVDQEMVQNVHEMSRRSRKCVMGLWTFVWRSMKCVNRYRKWLQLCGLNQSQLLATVWLPQPQSPSYLQIVCAAREGSRGAKQCWMDPKMLCACAFSFGIHSTLFCSSSALARAARGNKLSIFPDNYGNFNPCLHCNPCEGHGWCCYWGKKKALLIT